MIKLYLFSVGFLLLACTTNKDETVLISKEEVKVVNGDTTILRTTEVVEKSSLEDVQKEKSKEIKVLVVNQKMFDSILKVESNTQLLDVRTEGEYSNGKIENAELCDILNGDFEKRISSLDKKKPVLIYCKSGGRSTKARKLLIQNDFEYIVELENGYSQYKQD